MIVATMLAFALAGCAPVGRTNDFGGAVVPPAEFSTKTDIQTLDEALAHADDLVRLLGGEWLDAGVPPGVFDPTDRSGWSSGPCGAHNTNQYAIFLQQVAPVADPTAKIEQVREHWKGLGYRVRQIGPAETSKTMFTEIVVDLPFGAGLSFNASTTGMGITTEGECVIKQ
ncbi:hypothetical protein [Leifsonia shinshuensis]|uniref:Uncharacterized protein n=2 Tax=Leifsonia shinshuensis TaxID=150026 RepID=A0A853CV77_9MICO|nr:hypothetical protein [Leifsonia shinshuensis]